jgi:hypothetical protein
MGGLLVLAGFPSVAGTLLFGVLLFAIQAFLRFGWPYAEAFLETAEPSHNDPDSLRFDGFSTDAKVFLTLFAALFLGVITLALVASIG